MAEDALEDTIPTRENMDDVDMTASGNSQDSTMETEPEQQKEDEGPPPRLMITKMVRDNVQP